MPPLSPTSPPPLFNSFWMAGFEGADHVNGLGHALDMAESSGHIRHLARDHAAVAAFGMRSVRESVGWRLAQPRADDPFDFTRLHTLARSAREHGLQVLWTLMHYGTPAGVDVMAPDFADHFVRYAAAVARELRPLTDQAPIYTPINEIGFFAWALSETELVKARRPSPLDESVGGSSLVDGYAIKRRLAMATLRAMDAILEVDPRARFLHVEPLVHVTPPDDAPHLAELAHEVSAFQWQAWDLIAGRIEPGLGGNPAALDLIGVNHYHSGQWEVGTEARLHWHLKDPRRKPFGDLLQGVWQRYRRPLVVAETSHVGIGRAAWLDDIAAEVLRVREAGVPVQGLCLYPIVDRSDWNDPNHWHHSGLWDVRPGDASLARHLKLDYAKALRRWQRRLG